MIEEGAKFGRWTVVEYVEHDKNYKAIYLCVCQCGEIKKVCENNLKSGKSRSCGCLKRECSKKLMTTHDLSGHPIFSIWMGIKKRCTTPTAQNYKYYGGRGISFCKEWIDFMNFYNWAICSGWEEGLSIDRIDNDGNYCPENCRWVTHIEQCNNTRKNLMLTASSKTQTLSQWARELSCSVQTLHSRIRSGWDVEKALTTPIRKCRSKTYKEVEE